MAAPQNRVPVRVARGTKGNLDAALALGSLQEGELVYAKDQNTLYVMEDGVLVSAAVTIGNIADVILASPANNQYLGYNSTTSKWENKTATNMRTLLGIGSYTNDAAAGTGGVTSGSLYYNTTSSSYVLKT
jgi:hypothetical protein